MGSYDGRGGRREGGNTQRRLAGRVRLEGLSAILAKWILPTRLETRTKESNMCASRWVANPRGASNLTEQNRPTMIFCERFECEHACWDPKDGELCLSRAKPEETLVEARSDTDVQIVRRT